MRRYYIDDQGSVQAKREQDAKVYYLHLNQPHSHDILLDLRKLLILENWCLERGSKLHLASFQLYSVSDIHLSKATWARDECRGAGASYETPYRANRCIHNHVQLRLL